VPREDPWIVIMPEKLAPGQRTATVAFPHFLSVFQRSGNLEGFTGLHGGYLSWSSPPSAAMSCPLPSIHPFVQSVIPTKTGSEQVLLRHPLAGDFSAPEGAPRGGSVTGSTGENT